MGTVVIVVGACVSLLRVVLLPLLYGVTVVFRLFVLAPSLWGWLRQAVELTLQDVQPPKKDAIFAWEGTFFSMEEGENKVDREESVERAAEKLFGPEDTSEQLEKQLELLAGTLVCVVDL